MKTLKFLFKLLTIIFAVIWPISTLAQVKVLPVGDDGNGTSASIALPFNPSTLTNSALLASMAITNVDNIVVKVWNGADANMSDEGQGEKFVISFVGKVKSYRDMFDAVMNTSFDFTVVDPTVPTSVSIQFVKGTPDDNYWGDYATGQVLLSGNTYGTLIRGTDGKYTLNNEDSRIIMRLNWAIRMVMPGLVSGKAIHVGPGGSMWSSHLNVYANGDFDLPSDIVQSGFVVLFGNFGNGYETRAISFVTGQDIKLNEVHISVLLQSSEQVLTFVAPSTINVLVETYDDFGVTPLLIVNTGNNPMPPLPVMVWTTEGKRAKGYQLVNIKTGESIPVIMSEGGIVANILLAPNTEYHIIPDLPIKYTAQNVFGGERGGGLAGGDGADRSYPE